VVADHVPVDRPARRLPPGEGVGQPAVELGPPLPEQQAVGGLGQQAVTEPVAGGGGTAVHDQVGGEQPVQPGAEVFAGHAQGRGQDRLVELLTGDGQKLDELAVDAGRGQLGLQPSPEGDREPSPAGAVPGHRGQLLQVQGHAFSLTQDLLALTGLERGGGDGVDQRLGVRSVQRRQPDPVHRALGQQRGQGGR
jgi:hypothetical protein